ncbi:MAG TPA: nuclear transport factor 2 family protein [Candidatus Binatia bacterium]|nr:nuclear transport factor 2 family protein [Candidatus Binatia bacterium]
MSEQGDKLAAVASAWTAMLRSGRVEELAAILDDDVVWQGLLPELVCRGREQVLNVMVRNRGRPPRITRFEAEEIGDRVAVSVEGPDFGAGPGDPEAPQLPAGAPRSLVFTFRGGMVVRMESLPSRDAAFSLAAG